MISSVFLGPLYLPSGCLLNLFPQPVRENDDGFTCEEAEYPVRRRTKLNPALPDFFRSVEFLEIVRRQSLQFLHELQDPDDFLGILSRKRIQELPDRALPACRLVEFNLTHDDKLTRELTVSIGGRNSCLGNIFFA